MRKRNIVIRTWLIVLLLFKFGKRSEGAPLVFASVLRKGVILQRTISSSPKVLSERKCPAG